MLPFSLSAAVLSAVTGLIISKSGDYRWVMWISWVRQTYHTLPMTLLTTVTAQLIFAVGYGLMIQLDDKTSTYV